MLDNKVLRRPAIAGQRPTYWIGSDQREGQLADSQADVVLAARPQGEK